jgi:hypothetical protein
VTPVKGVVQRRNKSQLARDMKAAHPHLTARQIADRLGATYNNTYHALKRCPPTTPERLAFTHDPVVYLTTQEVARLIGSTATAIKNNVFEGHLRPAARAGKFARACYLWTEEQLPDIRRVVLDGSQYRARYNLKVRV